MLLSKRLESTSNRAWSHAYSVLPMHDLPTGGLCQPGHVVMGRWTVQQWLLPRQSQLADMREEVSSKPSLGFSVAHNWHWTPGSWYFLVSLYSTFEPFDLPATQIDHYSEIDKQVCACIPHWYYTAHHKTKVQSSGRSWSVFSDGVGWAERLQWSLQIYRCIVVYMYNPIPPTLYQYPPNAQ